MAINHLIAQGFAPQAMGPWERDRVRSQNALLANEARVAPQLADQQIRANEQSLAVGQQQQAMGKEQILGRAMQWLSQQGDTRAAAGYLVPRLQAAGLIDEQDATVLGQLDQQKAAQLAQAIQSYTTAPAEMPKAQSPFGKVQADVRAGYLTPELAQQAMGPKPTADQLEYQQAVAQGFKGSLIDYQRSLRAASAPATTVTVEGQKIPDALVKASIESSDRADMLETQAQELAMFRDLASGAETGAVTAATLPVVQAFREIGINLRDDVPLLESLQAQQNQMALRLRNPESGFGLTGNTSNRDIQFLKDAVAGIGKTPEGNQAVLTIMLAKQRRQAQLDRARTEYIMSKGTLAGWGEYKRKVVESPMFTPEEQAFMEGLKQGSPKQGSPASVDVTKLSDEELRRIVNGR